MRQNHGREELILPAKNYRKQKNQAASYTNGGKKRNSPKVAERRRPVKSQGQDDPKVGGKTGALHQKHTKTKKKKKKGQEWDSGMRKQNDGKEKRIELTRNGRYGLDLGRAGQKIVQVPETKKERRSDSQKTRIYKSSEESNHHCDGGERPFENYWLQDGLRR